MKKIKVKLVAPQNVTEEYQTVVDGTNAIQEALLYPSETREFRVFNIDIGKYAPQEALRFMNTIREQIMEREDSAQADVFVPVQGGVPQARIELYRLEEGEV